MAPFSHIMLILLTVMLTIMGMILLLLGIHNLFLGETGVQARESADRLRKDVENERLVISKDSLFHDFLARNQKGLRTVRPGTESRTSASSVK